MRNPNKQVPYEYFNMAPQKRKSIYNFNQISSFLQKQPHIRNTSLNIFLI